MDNSLEDLHRKFVAEFMYRKEDIMCNNIQYFSLNRILLLFLGLWPYEQSKIVLLQQIFLYSILLSFIIFQLTTFLTSKCSTQLIVEVLSTATTCIAIILKYSSYCFNMDGLKHIMDLLQHVLSRIKDQDEVAIMNEYGTMGKRFTIAILYLGICGTTMFSLSPLWPRVLDIIMPGNESRTYAVIKSEYFINQEKYSFFIMIHMIVALFLSGAAIVGVGTMNIVYIQLICGLFKIASHRLEQAISDHTLGIYSKNKQHIMCKRIMYAVDIHCEAMRLITFFVNTLEVFFFFIIGIFIISSSLNLFRICQELSSAVYDLERFIPSIVNLQVFYIYTFMISFNAQQISDHNDYVFVTVYNLKWYEAPLRVQKMLLFMLQRGCKPFYLLVGGIIVGSLECSTKMISASMSYFTMLYSTGKDNV